MFLTALRDRQPKDAETVLRDYDAAIDQSLKLSGPEFTRSFRLEEEPGELRNRYGGEFGQRLLLSRRLIERGCGSLKFPQPELPQRTGWDVRQRAASSSSTS